MQFTLRSAQNGDRPYARILDVGATGQQFRAVRKPGSDGPPLGLWNGAIFSRLNQFQMDSAKVGVSDVFSVGRDYGAVYDILCWIGSQPAPEQFRWRRWLP